MGLTQFQWNINVSTKIYIFIAVKNSPPVISKLQNYFNSVENPYIEVLRLIKNCQEFHNAKSKTLPMFIMEQFSNWCASPSSKAAHLLTQQLKLDAFKLVTKQNAMVLIKLVFDAFKLTEEKELFMGIVMCMIDKKQYKEVSVICFLLLYLTYTFLPNCVSKINYFDIY